VQSANTPRFWTGTAVSSAIVLLIATLFYLIWRQKGTLVEHPLDVAHLLRMSALQAGLTTFLSLLVGAALAWALNRIHFPGRALLVGLLSAALVTPGIVVAIGLISIWGRAGWLNSALSVLGLQTGSIFGLQGILYAHVILNATFAAAVLLAHLDALPANRLKLGQNLRFSAWRRFQTLDWPVLRSTLPGLGAIIFLLAFTSFPIVLTLGGGPANQTFEIAIYTAIRIDFDLRTAVFLALVQLSICTFLIIPASVFALSPPGSGITKTIIWRDPQMARIIQKAIIIVSTIGLGAPLVSVLLDGLSVGPLLSTPQFWQALGTSLIIGLGSALTTIFLSTVISMASISTRKKFFRTLIVIPSYIYLAVPGVTLSLGFFLGARTLGILPERAAPIVLVIANALLALPFALAILVPIFNASTQRYGRLCTSLCLSNWARFRWVEWPMMGREIGLVFAMGFCFSLGDLSIIALFGTETFSTLPWLMYRALGAYRTHDAAALAAILLLVSTLSFQILPRVIERMSRAGT